MSNISKCLATLGQLKGVVDNVKNTYPTKAEVKALVGTPLVAATAADMTDHSKIYVYTGSQTGYNNGHWYYWNGSAWADGGVYNAVAVDTDKTLSVENKAADAKKTGDELSSLKSEINKIDNIEPGLSEDAKQALLNCFVNVAWVNEHGQTYYDALENALYADGTLVRIEAVFTQGSAVIYPSTPLNDLKAYLVITGYYNNETSRIITDYSLSGTLEVGTSTITVSKNGKTTTFNVIVSASYWDYEWDASSETLPTYMTADYYDFTTESDAMFAKKPVLDFDYIGNCKLQIEMKTYCENENGQFVFGSTNNPQILIKNAVVDTNQFRGIKVIMGSNLDTSSDHGVLAVSVNGVNSLIPGSNSNAYHLYELTAENNFYTVMIDETPVTITQNTSTSAYYGRTGITTSAFPTPPGFYGAFIKSIKFKRL